MYGVDLTNPREVRIWKGSFKEVSSKITETGQLAQENFFNRGIERHKVSPSCILRVWWVAVLSVTAYAKWQATVSRLWINFIRYRKDPSMGQRTSSFEVFHPRTRLSIRRLHRLSRVSPIAYFLNYFLKATRPVAPRLLSLFQQ